MTRDCITDFFRQYRHYFEPYRNKHFFITGGTGFFGKWLLSAMAYANREWNTNLKVTILTRNPDKFVGENPWLGKQSGFDFVQGDVRNFPFSPKKCDFMIHAASEFGPGIERDHPGEVTSTIIDGTWRILDFAAYSGIEKLLYVSSGAVYGAQPDDLDQMSENVPCSPLSVYGKAKAKAEKMCLDSGINTVIGRCFAFVGAYLPLNAHFAIGNFIDDCLHDRDIIIKGDGMPLRSYMYAGDMVLWLLRILNNAADGAIYNVGSDRAVSIRELAETVRRLSGCGVKVSVLGTADESIPPNRYIPSIRKAVTELDLSIFTSLEQSLENTFNFYRKTGK